MVLELARSPHGDLIPPRRGCICRGFPGAEALQRDEETGGDTCTDLNGFDRQPAPDRLALSRPAASALLPRIFTIRMRSHDLPMPSFNFREFGRVLPAKPPLDALPSCVGACLHGRRSHPVHAAELAALMTWPPSIAPSRALGLMAFLPRYISANSKNGQNSRRSPRNTGSRSPRCPSAYDDMRTSILVTGKSPGGGSSEDGRVLMPGLGPAFNNLQRGGRR